MIRNTDLLTRMAVLWGQALVQLRRITTGAHTLRWNGRVWPSWAWGLQGLVVRALVEARKTNPPCANVHILAIVHVRAILCERQRRIEVVTGALKHQYEPEARRRLATVLR